MYLSTETADTLDLTLFVTRISNQTCDTTSSEFTEKIGQSKSEEMNSGTYLGLYCCCLLGFF